MSFSFQGGAQGAVSYKSIAGEHPDVTYYSQDKISMILSKGLSEVCRQKPRNPIEYFGNWLLKYSDVQKRAKQLVVEQKEVDNLLRKEAFFQKSLLAEEAERRKEQQAIEAR